MDELRRQSQFETPFNEVVAGGDVRTSGQYPLETGMRISNFIRAGGSISDGSHTYGAEYARFAVVGGATGVDLELTAHDFLSISHVLDWNFEWSVDIGGEDKLPGSIPILQGGTLRQFPERAGGLTDHAFPRGTIYFHESLVESEREQKDVFAARMEAGLTSMSLETLDTTEPEALQTGKTLLTQLRNAEQVGRLVIDLEHTVSRGSGATLPVVDIALRDGDRRLIAVARREVTVIGEARQPKSHLYQLGLNHDGCFELSGDFTWSADKKLIKVVRANSAVIDANRSKRFSRANNVDVRPGDTIVVPPDLDHMRPLAFWGNAPQKIFQSAIAIAAV